MEPQPHSESLQETLSVFAEARKPRTTPGVADRLDLGRRTTYARLELVERGAETDRFELRASAPPVVSAIASAGGYMQDVQIEDGDLYMTIHRPPTVATRRIVDTVQEAFPTAELLTQRQLTRSEHSSTRVYRTVTEALTDRQRAVLETAVYSGFFE